MKLLGFEPSLWLQGILSMPSHARRLTLFAMLTFGLALFQFPQAWRAISMPASTVQSVLQGRLSPWLVLGLGVLLLWRRRRQLWEQMHQPSATWAVLLGLVFFASSLLLPPPAGLVAGLGGLFIAFFGRAAVVPAVVVACYLTVVLFPEAVAQWIEVPYARTVLWPMTWLTQALGYPVLTADSDVILFTQAGSTFRATVAAVCAGPTTMALFLALFALMWVDRPLPLGPSAALFLTGLATAWLQNVLRLSGLLVAGYYGGAPAVWMAHEYSPFVVFPLWYFGFAALYLWIADSVRAPEATREEKSSLLPQRSALL